MAGKMDEKMENLSDAEKVDVIPPRAPKPKRRRCANNMRIEDFLASVAERFPSIAGKLDAAAHKLRGECIVTVEILRTLREWHWQRLGLPLGVAAVLQSECGLLNADFLSAAVLQSECGRSQSAEASTDSER